MGRLHLEASSTLTVKRLANENHAKKKGNTYQDQFRNFLHSSPLPLELEF